MKKIILYSFTIGLLTSTALSCKGDQKGQTNSITKAHDLEKKGSSIADHKRPTPANHKGPPRDGRGPEQTKTLEEIGGYKIGEVAADFNLKNIDGSIFSLANIKDAKGYIVTFTCNECPFAKMYEDRLIDIHNKYSKQGYSVIAINPNISADNAKENMEAMQSRAKEKKFPFVYLADEKHEIFPKFGAIRTPHIFLLDEEKKVQYIGSVDDNARSADDVKEKYLENAIQALQKGEKPKVTITKAIGCPVKSV